MNRDFEARLDKKTKQVVDAALSLPEFERAVLVRQLIAVLDGGDETDVLEAALKLSKPERWQVVDTVIATLDDNKDYDMHPSWKEEISRRIRQVESGKVETVSWEEVKARLPKNRAPG